MNITLPKFSFQERRHYSRATNSYTVVLLSNEVPYPVDFNQPPYLMEGFNTQYFNGCLHNLSNMVALLLANNRQPSADYGIICHLDYFMQHQTELIDLFTNHATLKYLPFVVIDWSMTNPQQIKQTSLLLKQSGIVDDFYVAHFKSTDLLQRLLYLQNFKLIKPELDITPEAGYRYTMPVGKRVFDILFALSMLIVLSPLLLLIAIAIKLESKGPVLYKSKRAGSGYKIFDFYKFRSMTTDADQQLTQLQHLNQYTTEGNQPAPSFVKINNDPRITTIGKFIRNTSLDELPQLINVLKGDMSVVGNRPLPLYEAVQLTRDEWAMRFLAPAGITGLWQVSKRGKADMSALERIQLDNEYAQKGNFWFDLKIILQTLPAMRQKETV